MKVTVNKKPKSTLEINVVVEKSNVKKTYDELFREVVKNAEIKGFRKGQAPEDLVKEKTDISKLYGEVINKLLQTYYPQALKEQHIHPVSNPQVEIKEFDLEKDFEFTATVAVRPEIKVGDYEKELKKTYELKTKELSKQNQEAIKKGEEIGHDHAHLSADDVINAILSKTKIEVADILVDEETERMMTRLINQAQTIGLSLEQYLQAQGKTADSLRQEYKILAEKTVKAEFALSELVMKEEIKVDDIEVVEMVKAAGDPEAEKALQDPMQAMYIKSIIAKNKLINKIAQNVEGTHENPTKTVESKDKKQKKEKKKKSSTKKESKESK